MARKKTKPVEESYEVQMRRKKALELRLAGKSQTEIAEEMGLHKSTISAYIQHALANVTRERAEEYLAVELGRLDAMHSVIWPQIVSPANDEQRARQTWLIDRALAIMDQRAKLTGTYKAAELRAIAEAKGGGDNQAASMIVDLFVKLAGALGGEAQAPSAEAEDEQPGEEADSDGDQ
ncbi:sigma factor-like helix-turn-helix DNA-binding protein [Nocardia farcinica]|uniref:sigma factor-like helix-turn-helix DNA-binding protein n=1 Tax=Nocardia farcinica TaxID=37329 RepID=UPI002458FC8A|nr:sigma factor-like helix-turn-helix DNA-binding protein [Nocardia farcinica]